MPGEWQLRVGSSALPALHTIEQPDRTLILKAGQQRQVAVRVLPQRRSFKLLERGSVR